VVGSWGAQVPGVLLCTQFWRDDIYGLFCGVAIGYATLDVILLYFVVTTDFQTYADQAKLRSEAQGDLQIEGVTENQEIEIGKVLDEREADVMGE